MHYNLKEDGVYVIEDIWARRLKEVVIVAIIVVPIILALIEAGIF